jgi:hypothetical protein
MKIQELAEKTGLTAYTIRFYEKEGLLGSRHGDDLGSLESGAAAADGVIHLAFKHDFSDFAGSLATDLRAVETIGAALEGSGKPFVKQLLTQTGRHRITRRSRWQSVGCGHRSCRLRRLCTARETRGSCRD